MQPSHERYCDRGHTLRQPYNAALASLAPAGDGLRPELKLLRYIAVPT